jgi:poly-gamma-glutamate capsule biosynthesis protein CapA/YwtB (metallophosphatase superfamily)
MTAFKIYVVLLLALCCASGAVAETAPQTAVTIAAVGDIMMGTDFPCNNLPPDDGRALLSEVKGTLQQADIAFGNLEGPLCDGGVCAKDTDSPNVYAFRTPTRFVSNLAAAGFKVLSLANNHAQDFGDFGCRATKRALTGAGLKFSSKDGEVAEMEIRGLKVGLVALAFGPAPRSIVYPGEALAEIESLAKKYDMLLVSIHWGREGRSAQHVEDASEYFLGEPRGNPVKFAHAAIDKGAALVIGHGPHVARAMEIYRNRLIVYSLGNFCTYKGISLIDESGYAPLLVVELAKNGEFLQGRINSFQQSPPGGPQPDENAKAFNLVKNLSLEDFPESCPLFTPCGELQPLHKKAAEGNGKNP